MRIDTFLIENGFFDSRTKAKQSIERGEVYLKDKQILKASFSLDSFSKDDISVIKEKDYVSIGAYKIEKALKDFNFSVENLTCADLGSSTGGFTDCLLQYGAKKVYAIDVNTSILHDKLKADNRVISLKKNVKDVNKTDFSDEIDLAVCDLSFISATLVLPAINAFLYENKHVILLIKPQFEMQKRFHAKNGILKDFKQIRNAIKNVYDSAMLNGLIPINFTSAPFYENKNREYLILLEKNSTNVLSWSDI